MRARNVRAVRVHVCRRHTRASSQLHKCARVCACARVASASRIVATRATRTQAYVLYSRFSIHLRTDACDGKSGRGGREEGVRGGEVKCVVSTNQHYITHSTTPRQQTVGWPLHRIIDDTQCVCQAMARPRAPAPCLSPPHHPPPASWPGAI
jgi:hypothetical protein